MHKKINKLITYPILTLLVTLIIYALFLWSSNFTARMYFYTQDVVIDQIESTKVSFDIYSKENFLGIISVKDLGEDINYDAETLEVSLYDKNGNYLIQKNSYNAQDLINQSEFLFGFKVQENSKNKQYRMQLQVNCFEKNNCDFHPTKNEIMVRHYFSKKYLFSHPEFIIDKIVNNLFSQNIFKSFAFILSPLIAYFAVLIYFENTSSSLVKSYRNYLLRGFGFEDILLYITVIIDVLSHNNFAFLFLLVLNLYLLKKIKKTKKEIFLIRNLVFLFILSMLFTMVNMRFVGDRISVWVYLMISSYVFLITFHNKLYQPKRIDTYK